MNTKRQLKCNTNGCLFITHKRSEINKHLKSSQHKDGVSVNDYVWQEDRQMFGIIFFTLCAVFVTALVLGVSS